MKPKSVEVISTNAKQSSMPPIPKAPATNATVKTTPRSGK